MSESDQEFSALMQRVREGSQDAARELLERYGPHIIRVVRRKLNTKLRAKFDSSDFTQAVWASFFASPPQDYTFDRPEALIGFLANLARNKVIDVVRQRFKTRKYDINREQSLNNSAAQHAAGLAAPEPTPSQVAMAKEQWDRFLEDLPDHSRRILVLLREGYTRREIAEALGIDERTVRRVISKLIRGTIS